MFQKKVVENSNENPMVRHEATEALGAIASKESLPLLQKYLLDKEDVVKESCAIALDIQQYFETDQFQVLPLFVFNLVSRICCDFYFLVFFYFFFF